MNENEGNTVLKFLGGLVSGIVLAILYIRFGFELPGIIGLEQKLIDGAVTKAAEMELLNQNLDDLSRRRALALILANRPDTFLEVDQSMDNRFFREYVNRYWPEKTIINPPQIIDSKITPIGLPGIPYPNIKPGIQIKPPLVLGKGDLDGLRSRFPQASDEVIAFLRRHPELYR